MAPLDQRSPARQLIAANSNLEKANKSRRIMSAQKKKPIKLMKSRSRVEQARHVNTQGASTAFLSLGRSPQKVHQDTISMEFFVKSSMSK